MFVNTPYKFIKENPKAGIRLKVMFFALEESKEEFMYSLITNRLKEVYGISVSVSTLQSISTEILSEDLLNKIKDCKEYFEDLSQCLDVIDGISNATGIYKYVREYSQKHGTHYYYNYKTDKEKKHVITESEYHTQPDRENYAYAHYTPNDPNEYVIVICDHLSLLQTEAGAITLHESMTRMSAEYARKQITKHFKYVFVGTQQQASDKEKLQFTTTGRNIEQKLEPSLDGLADNKTTQRDKPNIFIEYIYICQLFVISLIAESKNIFTKLIEKYVIDSMKYKLHRSVS